MPTKTQKKSKMPPGRPFKKGHPGGPGRPRKDPDLKKAEKLTKTEAMALLTKFMQMDVNELEGILRDRKRKVIEHIIGRVALLAIKNGDHARLNFVLDRLIGKVSDKVEHTLPKPTLIRGRNGEQIFLGAAKEED